MLIVLTKNKQSPDGNNIQWSLTYPDYSLILTHVWEPIPIHQQLVPNLSRNSVIRTVSLGKEVSG